jgi:hypothetical protein
MARKNRKQKQKKVIRDRVTELETELKEIKATAKIFH